MPHPIRTIHAVNIKPGMSIETSPGRFEHVYDTMTMVDEPYGSEPGEGGAQVLMCKLEWSTFEVKSWVTPKIRVIPSGRSIWPSR
jgi:hypothetical protein